jgi:monoamine oxidase
VIVAVPPTLSGRLDYRPALPAWRDQLTQRVPAGTVAKCFAAYPTPFWRSNGLNGQAISDTGPVKVTFDVSPPGGEVGILLGFVEGGEARRWQRLAPEQRRSAVLGRFVHHFGPEAANPASYVEKDWSQEEFSRGCYGAHFGPGTWTSYGPALREPVGRIHWAGAEYAVEWSGYMEGAVRSGRATADEVVAELDRRGAGVRTGSRGGPTRWSTRP